MSNKELKSANINLWSESLRTSISSFGGVASDVIHVFILVRFLSQEQIGLFFICYAFLYLFSQVARGFSIAIRKIVAEREEDRSMYLWGGVILILPSLIVLYALFLVSQPLITEYTAFEIPKKTIIAFYFATLGFSSLEVARYYVAGCGEPGLAEKMRTLLAKTTMPILTVLFLLINSSVEYALYAVFISYFSSSIIMFLFVDYKPRKPTRKVIKQIISFSKWSIITSLLNDFYNRFDTILLGVLVSTVAVSYYDSSVRIAFLAVTIATGISKTSNVKMTGLIEINESVDDIIDKTMITCSILTIPAFLFLLFNSEYILNLAFGQQYTGARWYLILLSVVSIFQGYRFQFEAIFNSYDMPELTTRTSLLSVIVNVITAPPLVIYLGGLGVLYSTIIAEIVRVIAYEYQILSELGRIVLPKGVIMQYVAATVIILILFALNIIFEQNYITVVLSGIIATFGFYVIQYAISTDTREIIREYKNEN